MKTLLKNGFVIDYISNTSKVTDLLIEENTIQKIEDNIQEMADFTIDCTGLSIIPGMIDIHCHLREPGFEHKETILTGSKSAVKGGFTTICPMPNTSPTPDSTFVLEQILEKIKEANLCNVLPYAPVTKGQKGEELVNFEELKKAGAIAFSDDGHPVTNSAKMREAIIQADKLGTYVASHCEDMSLGAGSINYGKVSEELKLQGVHREAETVMAAREVVLAEANGARAHICHISAKETVAIIRDAKARGVKVTCETCPHYYSLTEEITRSLNANTKMNPPLRTEEDRQAVVEALKDGTIDAIVTDHAPHAEEEKNQEFEKTPNGIIGFETALAVTNTYLIQTGKLTYLDLVRLTSYNPAKILGIERGVIKENAIADLTIFDPNKEYIYTKESIVSKSKNSPYIGMKLKGEVQYTMVSGRIVYQKEEK